MGGSKSRGRFNGWGHVTFVQMQVDSRMSFSFRICWECYVPLRVLGDYLNLACKVVPL